MFSHKLSSIPNQNYRVETYPTIEQLKEMIDKACKMSGVKHNYLWEVKKDSKKFTLSLHLKEEGEDLDWWMYEENMHGTKMVWFHKTKDIAVIYPHILSALGARHPSEEGEPLQDPLELEAPSLGERLKRNPTLNPTLDSLSAIGDEPGGKGEAASVAKLMTGNLRMRPIAWLLQTAAQSDVTGELLVLRAEEAVTVQFGLGKPVHAYTKNKTGAEAVLELFTWQDGTASFVEGKQPTAATVQESLEEIMKQGTSLLEDLGFLRRHSVDEKAALSRPPIGLSEAQLEQRLKDGPDFGLDLQRRFYKTIDGRLPLCDVGDRLGLDKSRLIAMAVNFLKLGLVLTPDGRSLRQVAQATSAEAFASLQGTSGESGVQKALTPPAGFFGSTMDLAKPQAPGQLKRTAELGAPPMPPKGTFAGGDITASSDTAAGAQRPGQALDSSGSPSKPETAPPNNRFVGVPVHVNPDSDAVVQTGGHTALEREFFDVGVPAEMVTFDGTAAQTVFRTLVNRQTGVLTFPAFQMFLEREFARAFRFSSEFSLLVFCIRLGSGGDGNSQPSPVLPMKSVMLATTAISQIKRDVDLLGHFGDKCFGLILPGVGASQSVALVDRIVADLPKLAPKLGGCWPILHFGVAGVPGDARDVVSLMNAAQKAMIEAADRSYTRILYSEMDH